MKILCLTPIKHLDGIYEYLETFGEVDYRPDMNDFDFSFVDMDNYDVIFCNPNKQNYKLDEYILKQFNGTILTASTGLNHIDIDYCNEKGIKVMSHKEDMELLNELPSTSELTTNSLPAKYIICLPIGTYSRFPLSGGPLYQSAYVWHLRTVIGDSILLVFKTIRFGWFIPS